MKKQTKKKKNKELTEAHKAFIDEYLISFNATAAYMRTHPKVKYNSARTLSSKLLTNIDIREELERRFEARAMGAKEVIARLADMARASLDPFIAINGEGFASFDFSGEDSREHVHLIRKLRSRRSRKIVGKGENAEAWEDESIEVELHDSQAALDKIAKILRLYEDPEGDEKKFTAPQVVEIIKTYEQGKDSE